MNRPVFAFAALVALAACGSEPQRWADFSKLRPPSIGSEYLLCGPAICPLGGKPRDTLRFSYPAEHVAAVVAGLEPSAVQRQLPNGDFQLRYTVKAPTARVADDVDVLVRADSAYTAEVAIYSRTRITTVDLGKNKARVEKLVADLTAELGEPLP
ncbi:MAG TPA: DUF1499 domain-containing protein [Hyphomonas sp.]|nr:DUF1499 domain-containing protein [Hyphomonas sp.]MCA8904679.1 DUF1499 domain-containing protein [Hyphomonas sp.]MCB9961025.1 DUF1499 domain-containing protein [Hyphomonas sp.]MCB9970316.1 DUF1499 domain-containing protein [Hyphomonas sp.]HPE48353.1 DUF1499 domain-containing protein [Hyphomonas sp.]